MKAKLMMIHAITPLHVGIGRGIGYIDLPVVREKTTNWPVVPGSSIKGTLADLYQATDDQRKKDPDLRLAFGCIGDDLDNAGALMFSDAHLLCMPIRSLYGTFAWVTCPFALNRFLRDLKNININTNGLQACQNPANDNQVLICDGQPNSPISETGGVMFLEDYELKSQKSNVCSVWAAFIAQSLFGTDANWKSCFIDRFAIVTDNMFGYFCETATEVSTRIRINDETKIVEKGALWTEESLPSESILYGLVLCDDAKSIQSVSDVQLMQKYCANEKTVQLGGHASIGRGLVRLIFS